MPIDEPILNPDDPPPPATFRLSEGSLAIVVQELDETDTPIGNYAVRIDHTEADGLRMIGRSEASKKKTDVITLTGAKKTAVVDFVKGVLRELGKVT
jgi:hypothetical protein